MKKIISAACLATALLAAAAGRATNYYVHPERGQDANAGTQVDRPLRTLAALQRLSLSAGDSILLAAGYTFPGTLLLSDVAGSKKRPIVITTYPGAATVADRRARIDARGYANGIFIRNGRHLLVQDLIIEADGGGMPSTTGDAADMRCGLLVQNSRAGRYGNIRLERLLIRNVFYEDPGVSRSAEETRSANGTQRYGWGIRFINDQPDARLEDLQVLSCTIENVAHTGIKFTGREQSIHRIKVYDNRVIATGGPGIQMSGVRDGHIRGNYVNRSGSPDDSRKWGRGSGLWTWGSSRVIIEENTFMNANGPGDSAGCHIDFNCRDVVVQYNFSANNAGGFCEILGNNYNCAYRYNISVNDGHRVKGQQGAFQEGKIFWLSGYQGQNKERFGPFNSYFYNNTIYVDPQIVAKIAIDRAASGILIANNIFYIAGESQAVLGDQYRPETAGASQIQSVVFTNNLYLKADNWPATISIQDEAPHTGDPAFLTAGGLNRTDYIPANTAAVKDRGVSIQPLPGDKVGLFNGLRANRDILGRKISGQPDIGAIEIPD